MGLIPSGIVSQEVEELNGEQMSTIFAFSKTCVAFGRDIFHTNNTRMRHPEGLYVINHTGILSEFSLDTSGIKQHSRVTDDSPIDVQAQPLRQWPLQRQRNWSEVRAPLSLDSPLVLAATSLSTGSADALRCRLESKRQRTASMSSRLAQDERRSKTNNSPRSRHSR